MFEKPLVPLLHVDKNRVMHALCPVCKTPIRSYQEGGKWFYVEKCDKCGQKILDEQKDF